MSFFETRIQIGTPSGGVPPADFDPQDVDLRLSWSCGRTDLRSAEYASTLVFSIPWRARGVDPDFPVGSTVYLTLGAIIGGTVVLRLEHTVTEVVVDSDVLKVTATSPEWRILDGDTATVTAAATGDAQLAEVVADQTGTTIALHPATWGGGNITTTALPVGEMFTAAAANTLHGRLKKGYQPGGLFPPARLSFVNSELAGIGDRTPIDILPEWIIRSPQSVRAAVNSPDTITVAGYSATVTRSTGLGTNIATTVTTQLDATADLDAIADGLEDAWTDLPSKPFEGWLPRAVTILLDKVYDDTGEDLWVEIVGASLVHLDDATPIRTVNVPVVPPSTPSGSWTFLPCYVEGVQLQRTPEGSTARLYCVPEELLRRRDVLDIVTDPANVKGWWDALDASSITLSGSAVETWTTRSGTRNLEQLTGSYQPTVSSMNGRRALNFDGSNDRLVTDGTLTIPQPITLVAVVDPDTLTGGNRIINVGATRITLGWNATPRLEVFAGGGLYLTAGSSGPTGPQVIIAVIDGASSSLWQDGVLLDSGTLGTNSFSGLNLNLGAGGDFDGKIGELMVIAEALDTDQIAALTRSLQQKWGI